MSAMRWVTLLVATQMFVAAPVIASNQERIEAIWKPQNVAFIYSGTTTTYTCRELASKLKRVLRKLGAHEDIVVDRTSCSEFTGAQLRVRFRAPVPATIDNIAAVTTYDPTEVLAARLNASMLPTADQLPRFAAVWQEVSFSRDASLRLDPSDCQFVEDVRKQMLPRLEATTISNRLFCTPGHPGISRPKLRVRVLLAATTADEHKL